MYVRNVAFYKRGMGAVRLMLAFGVLLAHMNDQIMPAVHAKADFRLSLGIIGGHSVMWFYIISGFLMSTVLDTKYDPDLRGTLAFFKSRALRIYPLWITVFFFCALFVRRGNEPGWFAQHGTTDTLQTIMLLGQDWRLIFTSYPTRNWSVFAHGSEVGWTLGAELTFTFWPRLSYDRLDGRLPSFLYQYCYAVL